MDRIVVRTVYFTENGRLIADRLKAGLPSIIFEERSPEADLMSFTKESFKYHLPLLFIGSCGIAVRAIAPFVDNKLKDSPVIVVDELGKNAIPVLSGHYGGANELARALARAIGANPVITTATDLNNVFAIDTFARKNGFRISDKQGIKAISSRLLKNEQLKLYSQYELKSINEPAAQIVLSEGAAADIVIGDEPQNAFTLIPKRLVIGMGCKKNKSFHELHEFLSELYSDDYLMENLFAIATIDIKAEEIGLIKLAQYFGARLLFYSAEELGQVMGSFSDSDFVNETVGISNICERAACLGAGHNSRQLIVEKTAKNGITLAAAMRQSLVVDWDVA